MSPVYVLGICGAGIWYAWDSGDWPSLALVPVVWFFASPWLD